MIPNKACIAPLQLRFGYNLHNQAVSGDGVVLEPAVQSLYPLPVIHSHLYSLLVLLVCMIMICMTPVVPLSSCA